MSDRDIRWAEVELAGRRMRVDFSRGMDLSLPLKFGESQPRFFAAPAAAAHPYAVGAFTGSVLSGASCNCSTYTVTPHCNGTHTECLGHVTQQAISVLEVAPRGLLLAQLVTVAPVTAAESKDARSNLAEAGDAIIDRERLQRVLRADRHSALVVRTRPNEASKRQRDYDAEPAPYFTAAAMQAIVEREIEHLIVDVPSVDRAHDGGALAAHRVFWGLPPGAIDRAVATRPQATITELAYIDDAIPDGDYLVDLQIAPFATDAAPSRPLLYPLIEMGTPGS